MDILYLVIWIGIFAVLRFTDIVNVIGGFIYMKTGIEKHLLHIENLSYKYERLEPVLKNISIDVYQGGDNRFDRQ